MVLYKYNRHSNISLFTKQHHIHLQPNDIFFIVEKLSYYFEGAEKTLMEYTGIQFIDSDHIFYKKMLMLVVFTLV